MGLAGGTDPIKATTADAARQLHDDGMRLVMLTGGSHATAQAGVTVRWQDRVRHGPVVALLAAPRAR